MIDKSARQDHQLFESQLDQKAKERKDKQRIAKRKAEVAKMQKPKK
jgi:hypothetical protein